MYFRQSIIFKNKAISTYRKSQDSYDNTYDTHIPNNNTHSSEVEQHLCKSQEKLKQRLP